MGFQDTPRPRCPCSITTVELAELIRRTLASQPPCCKPTGPVGLWLPQPNVPNPPCIASGELLVSNPTGRKIFSFPLSHSLGEKVRDIAGLSLNPSAKALVLGVLKKSQIQALDRCQPVLSQGIGSAERCGARQTTGLSPLSLPPPGTTALLRGMLPNSGIIV